MKHFDCKCLFYNFQKTLFAFLKPAACLLLLCMLQLQLLAQARLTATASSGSAYPVISAAGFGNENPDCIHTSFGPHVTQANDADLGKNVFVFHSHITDDNDRCINLDRVRMEIKGGGSSEEQAAGQTAYFRWKFKLDANFIGGSSFCHIFQIKAVGGDDTGAPLITITPRASILEVIHDGGDESGSVDLGRLVSVNLAPFKGTWVEGYIKYTSSDNGSFAITLTRVSDGAVLLSYSKTSGIDLWRTGASRNHPKWGVYRSKNSTGLRNEQVRFADFCISESSASQCPSDAGSTARMATGDVAPAIIPESNSLRFTNPVSGAVNIQVNLATDGITSLTVFDLTGRQVGILVNSYLPKGRHTVLFDKKELPAGVYVLKLAQKGKLVTRQLIKQ
jgi:hypothetical protein